MSYEDWLGKVVEARTGPGALIDIGTVISYSAHPTFTIIGNDGRHFSWACHLCSVSDGWTTLDELRPGAIFKTPGGLLAVKSESQNGDGGPGWGCVILENGQEITALGNQLVREIKLPFANGV